MTSHVTQVLDCEGSSSDPKRLDAGPPYVAICQCKWHSSQMLSRAAAVLAADAHRSNMTVQEG